MAEMNTDEMDCSDIEEAWKEGCASLIPEKSKRRYELAYEKFMKWVNDKKTNVNLFPARRACKILLQCISIVVPIQDGQRSGISTSSP